MRKRCLSLVLVMAMVSCVFTACGNTTSKNVFSDDVVVEAGDSTTDKGKQEEPKDYFTQMGFKLSPNMTTYLHVFFEPNRTWGGDIYMEEGFIEGEIHVLGYVNGAEDGFENEYYPRTSDIVIFDKYTGTYFKEGINIIEVDGKEYEIELGSKSTIAHGVEVGAFTRDENVWFKHPEGYDGMIIGVLYDGVVKYYDTCKETYKIDEIELYYYELDNSYHKKSFMEIKDEVLYFSLDNKEKMYPEAPDLEWSDEISGQDRYVDMFDGHMGFDVKQNEEGINYLVYHLDGSIYYPGDIIPGGIKWMGDDEQDREYIKQRLNAE